MGIRKSPVVLFILFILVQTKAFSQTGSAGLQEQVMQQMMGGNMPQMMGGSMQQMMGGAAPSMVEMLYMQQMLGQERSRGGVNSLFQTRDTSNLFLGVDSALGMPLLPSDTLSYVMAIDTIAIDSLSFYTDIEELRGIAPDGKRRIVLRKKRVPRSLAGLRRYEADFFQSANPSIFSGVTSGVSGNYPLKPGDKLILTVWGAVEKEMPLVINNQGRVNVESVGMVSLIGTTLAEAEGILKARLSKIYSGIGRGQTFVNLRLESLSPVKIFLLGEIEKPGAYTFYGNTTIFQALYMAGGPSKEGSARSIQVARADSIFKVDLYDYLMQGKNASKAILFDGDIVFLPRAKILAEVDGAVGRPAIYELKEGEGVAQLISFANGINLDAAEQSMVLKRVYPDGRKDYETISKPNDYISGKDTLSLRNGDALLVYRSVEESMFHATILGAVKYPGTYQLRDSMTAANLVEVSGGLKEAGYSGRVHVLRAVPQGGYQLFSQNLNNEMSIDIQPRDTLVVYSLKEMFRPDSVSIGGAVLNPGYYQYYEGMDAKDLVLLAGGYLASSKKSSLSINRLDVDGRVVESTEYSVQDNYDSHDNAKIRLQAWNHVEIPYDSNFYRPELVVLAGAFKRPGVYSLSHPDENLESLIRRAGGFLDEAYLDGAKFFRRSMLEESDSIRTLGLVGINISKVLKKEKRNNINLMDGDSIHVPQRPISVRVSGEVGKVTNVLWKKGATAQWYTDQAGGVNLTGDKDRVVIIYANGSVSLASKADRPPDPGSEVFVPYKKPPEPVVWTQIVSALGTILTAAGTFLIGYATIYK